MEKLLGRKVVWLICQLHTNELGLRHLFAELGEISHISELSEIFVYYFAQMVRQTARQDGVAPLESC